MGTQRFYVHELDGKCIKALREETGFNRREFSDYFNIPYRTIENWENGTNKCPDYLLELLYYKAYKEHLVRGREVTNKIEKDVIVFLDYDGVVNNYIFDDYPTTAESDGGFRVRFAFPEDGFVNNFQAVCWLNELYKAYNYDIVVTSTWRHYLNYADCLYKSGFNKEINIVGCIDWSREENREYLIHKWLNDNKYSGAYIILDDEELYYSKNDPYGFREGHHLIITDINVGFNSEKFYKALEEIKIQKQRMRFKQDD